MAKCLLGGPAAAIFWLLLCSTAPSSQQETTTRFDYPRANLNTGWSNWPGERGSIQYSRNITVRALLLVSPAGFFGTTFACGFHRSSGASGYTFSVIMVYVNSGALITMSTRDPVVVWSANRNHLVGENATVALTSQGNLVLLDENQDMVWSSKTSAKGVSGSRAVVAMEILRSGNLVLLDKRDEIVWQSFNSPTDTLVSGQWLRPGMRLTSSRSLLEQSGEGDYFLEMTAGDGLVAYVGRNSSSPQAYWSMEGSSPYMLQVNGSTIFTGNRSTLTGQPLSNASSNLIGYRYLRLAWDGSLKIYNDTNQIDDLFTRNWLCDLPQGCGPYSLCTRSGTCSCSYAGSATGALLQVDERASELGCRVATPLSACKGESLALENQTHGEQYMLRVDQADYFGLKFMKGVRMASIDDCQKLCLSNCSCKGAFFVVNDCYVVNELYSLREPWKYENAPLIRSSALIKLQKPAPSDQPFPVGQSSSRNKARLVVILAIAIPVLLALILVALVVSHRYRQRRRRHREMQELALDTIPGVPRRFMYKEISVATQEFKEKLGEGGFGSVFLGKLPDGSRVAVKRLESVSQGHKEFRSEVITIGSIHHFNLVQLRGFCTEGDMRLLVYEHVANGSLDNWLFQPKTRSASPDEKVFIPLSWKIRLKIALGTARGLAYLHEGCQEKIIHLDIKPQNILLDSDFNAKLCDFGMSKLMTREETHVFTTMRGTQGYLAPEWLQSSITEKADVFSFGIVLLELLSGKRCLDTRRAESSKRYLALWVSNINYDGEQIDGEQLADLVDENVIKLAKENDFVKAQVEAVLLVAVRCIIEEPEERPSMESIVRELEHIQGDIAVSRGGKQGSSLGKEFLYEEEDEGEEESFYVQWQENQLNHGQVVA